MTDEEVTRSWALWTAGEIKQRLDDEGIVDVEDEAFGQILVDVLTDIAVSNATRATQRQSTDITGEKS